MPESVRSISIRPMSVAELLGRTPVLDKGACQHAELGVSEGQHCLSVFVIIDGWHVRKNLALDLAGVAVAQDIVVWIDALTGWLIDRYLPGQECIAVSMTAWDADISAADLNSLKLANARPERLARLEAGRSVHLADKRSEIADAVWNFIDLRSGPIIDRQVGVDPLIERDLYGAYIKGADAILLVTRDADYCGVVEAICKHAGRSLVEILTLSAAETGSKRLKAYQNIGVSTWAWPNGKGAPTQ